MQKTRPDPEFHPSISDPEFLRLTDDFNPIDVEESWMREGMRRNILDDTPRAILLDQE